VDVSTPVHPVATPLEGTPLLIPIIHGAASKYAAAYGHNVRDAGLERRVLYERTADQSDCGRRSAKIGRLADK